MNTDLPGLTGTSNVQTASFIHAQLALTRAHRLGDIAVISGPAGCGKTFALARFIDTQALSDSQHTYLEMPPKPSPKEVTVRALKAVHGTVNSRLPQHELTDQLVDVLAGSGHVLIVDEAHNLGTSGLQQLRYLHQRGQFTWTLVMCGSRLADTLEPVPELATRTEGIVTFEPLTDAELLPALRAWHPFLAHSSDEQLRYVDRQHAHGNFRVWAKFLRAALELAAHTGDDRLSDRVVSGALSLHHGQTPIPGPTSRGRRRR